MRNLLISIVLLSCKLVLAGVVELPATELQRIVVKGWDAQVTVTSNASKNLRISGVDDVLTPGLYIVQKRGNNIEITLNEWTSKMEWKSQASRKIRRNIDISGPSLPIEIYLKEGNVILTKWQKEAKISIAQGKVTSTDGTDRLDVSLHLGDVNVFGHKAKVKIDQYQGTINIKNHEGDIDLAAFGSPVVIEKAKGFLSLNTQNSQVKVLQSSGTVQIDNGKGPVNIQQFQGRVEGSTQEGGVTAVLQPDSEVHLRSAAGRVFVQLPPSSGAMINLLTQEGEISLPENLKITRTATEKFVRGRLRGEDQKMAITVRAQEGSIVIK